MSEFDALPDDVRSKLKTDIRYVSGDELLPAEVAEVIFERDKPIWTASEMEEALDTGHKTETVRKKLDKLDELGICESKPANTGRIYWLDTDRSDWPIPPDVDFDDEVRKELEMTEDELVVLQQENKDLRDQIDDLQEQIVDIKDQFTVRDALRTEYIQFVLLGLLVGFASALVFALATLQAIETIQTPFATSSLLESGLLGLVTAFTFFILFLLTGAFAYAYDEPFSMWLVDGIRDRF